MLSQTLHYISEDLEPGQGSYMHYSIYYWHELTRLFDKKVKQEKTSREAFWEAALDHMAQFDPDSVCEDFDGTVEECHDAEKVNLLAANMFHTEWADDRRLPDIWNIDDRYNKDMCHKHCRSFSSLFNSQTRDISKRV